MSEEQDTLHAVAAHLALAMRPLRQAVSDLDSFRVLLFRLGWAVESLPPSWASLATLVDQALTTLRDLSTPPTPAEVAALLDQVRALYLALQALDEVPAGVDAAEFQAELGELGQRLFELLLVDYLAATVPTVYGALEALEVIKVEDHPATATRPGYVGVRLAWDEIPQIVTDPLSVPRRVYGWGTPELDFTLLAEHVHELLHALDVPASLEEVDPELAEGFQAPPEETAAPISSQLRVPLVELELGDEPVEAGLVLLELPAENAAPPGVILQPFIPPEVGTEVPIGPGLMLRLRAGTDLASTFGIVLRPGELAVRYPFQPGTQPPAAGFGAELVFGPATPALLLGQPAATRLEVGGLIAGLDLETHDGELELRARFALQELTLVIAGSAQDGFLAALLGGEDLTVPLPLTVEWSSRTGLSFSGSTGFAVSTCPHLALGPLQVYELQLAVRSTLEASLPPDLTVTAGVALGGALGPFAFALDNLGLRLKLVFAAGNAGPFDVAIGFQPPAGLGLLVDAGPVAGGGFLAFDHATGRYSGVLQLDVYGVAMTAIGLLDTRLPNGQPGYSFLIVISTEFAPVQLGLGFTLNGVGGLAGVDRSVAVDALQAGLRAHSLDHLLFPEDPIRDAPQLVSDLSTVFPPAPGRFIFGPMALIGWGNPTLVEAEIGLVLEVPEPVRLVLLGQVHARLPSETAPLVELHLDVLGVVEFAEQRLAIDASLHDSRVAAFDVSGDAALRLVWGAAPSFALAVGGLNPHFQPPPGFPALRRVTIALGTGANPRISLQAYLALTSNTVQVGALAELYAEAAGFNIYGWLGFDALFVLSPFAFVTDVTAGVALRSGDTVLAGIQLHATLSGPAPWHAVGEACISLLLLNVCVSFDATFGAAQPVALPPADPRPLLLAAIADPRNWQASAAAGVRPAVALRAPAGQAATFVDPAGGLALRQTVVPLGRRIARFGAAAPVGPDRYDVSSVTLGGQAVDWTPVQDLFAAAQFAALTDAEKLSRPSFEPMDAGVAVATDAVAHGAAMGTDLSYETIVVESPLRSRQAPPYTPARDRQLAQLRRGAAARAPLRRTSLARFAPAPGAPTLVGLAEERFVVVSTDDLQVRADISAPAARGAAAQALADYLAAHPVERGRVQVVPLHELEAVA